MLEEMFQIRSNFALGRYDEADALKEVPQRSETAGKARS